MSGKMFRVRHEFSIFFVIGQGEDEANQVADALKQVNGVLKDPHKGWLPNQIREATEEEFDRVHWDIVQKGHVRELATGED